MRFLAGTSLLIAAGSWLPAQLASNKPSPGAPAPPTEKLVYNVEWRTIRAGQAIIESRPNWAGLKLESAGLVSKLYKIQDTYSVNLEDGFCAASSVMDASEGKRHRESRILFDRAKNRAFFTERDLLKDTVVRTADVATPHCVHDVIGALLALRRIAIEPGTAIELPVSDGRKSALVKVEAQEREQIKTPRGTFQTIRFEADVLNGVVYARKGRAFIWISDDARRLPVQIRLRMNFPIGNVTLELEKEDSL